MPVTSVYRIGGGTSITTDNSSSLAAQSAANGALSSTLSNAGVTLTGAGLGVSTGLNVTGSTTLSGLTVQNALNVSGSTTLSGLSVAGGFASFTTNTQTNRVVLTGGTITINNSNITANSIVMVGPTTANPNLTVTLAPSGIPPNFTITGISGSLVNYFIARY